VGVCAFECGSRCVYACVLKTNIHCEAKTKLLIYILTMYSIGKKGQQLEFLKS